jgi:hypothetical protein
MPPFWIAGTAVHATTALIAAFFVFFAASRSGPALRVTGLILGSWLVVLAVAGVVFAVVEGPPPRPPMHDLPMTAPQPFAK